VSAHHPLGPSSLIRRAACPGSYRAELPLWDAPQAADADADRGTQRHAAAAEGLRTRERRSAILAGLDPSDAILVESWWGYWDGKIDGSARVIAAGVEDRVEIPGGRFGSVDAWMLWADSSGAHVLTVADLKGTPPGRARYNLQVADYCHGLASSLPHVINHRDVAIVSRAGVDEHRYEDGEHAARITEISNILSACQAESAPKIPGPGCTYCRAAESCEARRAIAVQASALADPVGAIMSLEPAQRTDLLDRLSLAVDRLTEARDTIKAEIREGRLEVPGYKTVPSSREAWKNPDDARAVLLAKFAERSAELTPLVSPSNAASLLGKEAISDLIERKPSTPSVRRMKGIA
jgi:hypothetical protein